MTVTDRIIDIGPELHIRDWPGDAPAFVLLHGLASNSRTWDAVAHRLAEAGHRVTSVDQRGHGQSAQPDNGYDFSTIVSDLARLLAAIQLDRPILVGQSWGGNVVLEFGARYPGLACGLGFVDGGFLDLQARPNASWQQVSAELRPPDLLGTPRAELEARLRAAHPDWSQAGIEATLGNFEILADDTVRPRLSLDHHMAILKALWRQRPAQLYPKIQEPVLICAAQDERNPGWTKQKVKQVAAAEDGLARASVHWLNETDHDIHVHRPEALADIFLESLEHGVWNDC